MPSVRYYNQTAPFWDFVASLEERGANHPFFGGNNNNNNNTADNDDERDEQEDSRGFPLRSWPFGPMPHRGRHGPYPPPPPHPPHHHPHGPPPPPPPGPGEHEKEHSAPPPPPEYNDEDPPISQPEDGEPGPSHPPRHHGHGHGPWGGRHGGRGRSWGGRGRGHCRRGNNDNDNNPPPPFFGAGFPFANLGPLAEMFQSQAHLWGGNTDANADAATKSSTTFTPEVDVFDTPDAFVVHISLPGAKKEDLGVDWDADKSELRVAGVVYRPGDEAFIKTLALDERRVGEFERKVRLGSRANPAQVDVEGITAKLEDGVLRVEVPKMESGFVEVRKVDVE